MGFFANRRFKKAQKKAQAEHQVEVDEWEADHLLLEKMETIFTAAENGEDAVYNTTVNERGEVILWSEEAIFHETRRAPSTFVGGSSGVSVPVGGGIRFRVGAMRGTAIPGAESQTDLDQGQVIVSTTRILFVGPRHTREWELAKLLSAATTGDESDYVFSVSNRQKSSGVRVRPGMGREFNRMLALAISAAEYGIPEVKKELAKIRKALPKEKPVLELPAPPA